MLRSSIFEQSVCEYGRPDIECAGQLGTEHSNQVYINVETLLSPEAAELYVRACGS